MTASKRLQKVSEIRPFQHTTHDEMTQLKVNEKKKKIHRKIQLHTKLYRFHFTKVKTCEVMSITLKIFHNPITFPALTDSDDLHKFKQ